MRSTMAFMAVLTTATQAQAAPSMAEHLARCEPGFFEVLRDYVARNGPVTRNSVVTKAGTWDELTFARPISAHGFRIKTYRQLQSAMGSEPSFTTWQWGLVIEAKPRTVAYAIDPYVRRNKLGEYGLRAEEGGGWSAPVGPYKAGRWRQLLVRTLGGDTLLSCFTFKSDYPSIPGLPDLTPLAISRD